MFLTFLVGKVMKENHTGKVRKSEERKVKNIGKTTENTVNILYCFLDFLFQ